MMPRRCGRRLPPLPLLKRAGCTDDPPRVIEALVVLLGVGLLGAAALAAALLPAQTLVAAGVFCAGAGLLVGVPTGLWYHVVLYRCLRPRGPLPERWWVRPVALHRQLEPEERPPVLVWFYAGGAGFLLSVLGCGLVVAGVLLEGWRAGVF